MTKLNFSVFQAPEKPLIGDRPKPFGETRAFDPMSSTLIYGENDAILVDPLTTIDEAEALSQWIKLFHRNLITIYITHGHIDHFAGAAIVLKHFPNAKVIATPETVETVKLQLNGINYYRKMMPGQIANALKLPLPYDGQSFELEGHKLEIIQQGHTDAVNSTSLYIPSLSLIVTGDVVYNCCHMYVGELTQSIYDNWLADLNKIKKLNPKFVVAGHKKPGTDNKFEIIDQTVNYLETFWSLKQENISDKDLFDKMGEKFPDWSSHQSWLMFGF